MIIHELQSFNDGTRPACSLLLERRTPGAESDLPVLELTKTDVSRAVETVES